MKINEIKIGNTLPFVLIAGPCVIENLDHTLFLAEKIKQSPPEKIAGITGDLTNMETLYIVKEFFNKTIKSKNLESRIENYYVNPEIPVFKTIKIFSA